MSSREQPLVCLTHEQALVYAHRHVSELPPPPEGFIWVSSEQGRRFKEGWFFDFGYKKVPPNPGGPGSGLGCPPGFVVGDDGRVQMLNLMEYTRLMREGTSHATGDD